MPRKYAAEVVVILLALAAPLTMAQTAPKIPGITAPDAFPRGCVDCHAKPAEHRFGTLMKVWTTAVDPALLKRIQAAAPKGMVLKGKHPAVAASLKDIPAACIKCHSKTSKIAPPFSAMMHALHYGGGDKSVFLKTFQGQCTHCHKPNTTTGQWTMPSGPEK